ncbi:MAG TPA: hypothetical protein VHX15_20715 [Frankiaceae bacterium]|jgi:hypothetical protein|nr:hypothetical protein [Frankiaceae bacterium]
MPDVTDAPVWETWDSVFLKTTTLGHQIIRETLDEPSEMISRIAVVPRGGLYMVNVLSRMLGLSGSEVLSLSISKYDRERVTQAGEFRLGSIPSRESVEDQVVLLRRRDRRLGALPLGDHRSRGDAVSPRPRQPAAGLEAAAERVCLSGTVRTSPGRNSRSRGAEALEHRDDLCDVLGPDRYVNDGVAIGQGLVIEGQAVMMRSSKGPAAHPRSSHLGFH